ncbi:hypothetical protein GYMLUDRAFT_798603 [Collybiopsis luxurians FD-317 M1]|nr:hypothetical protein GYMLUDRAFT_798603 [Collybiopsis luxurians FD-317 M1]
MPPFNATSWRRRSGSNDNSSSTQVAQSSDLATLPTKSKEVDSPSGPKSIGSRIDVTHSAANTATSLNVEHKTSQSVAGSPETSGSVPTTSPLGSLSYQKDGISDSLSPTSDIKVSATTFPASPSAMNTSKTPASLTKSAGSSAPADNQNGDSSDGSHTMGNPPRLFLLQ